MAETIAPVGTVYEVAEHLLAEHGDLDTLRLHTLVILAQSLHLSRYGMPLFSEEIHASAEGLAIPALTALHGDAAEVSSGFFYAKLREQLAPAEYQAHILDGGRCMFCEVSSLDDDIYGPLQCIKREQFTYTTETPH